MLFFAILDLYLLQVLFSKSVGIVHSGVYVIPARAISQMIINGKTIKVKKF